MALKVKSIPFVRTSDGSERTLMLFAEADRQGRIWLGLLDESLSKFEQESPFGDSIRGTWFQDIERLNQILAEHSDTGVKKDLISGLEEELLRTYAVRKREELGRILTRYDMAQEKKKSYNRYALAQYLAAADLVEETFLKTKNYDKALEAHFQDRLLDHIKKNIY